MTITEQALKELGFSGPWPHGEYYLFDPSCKIVVEKYRHMRMDNKTSPFVGVRNPVEQNCIMAIYPPDKYGNARISYNSQRAPWMDYARPGDFNSGWIKIRTLQELHVHLEKSRNLIFKSDPEVPGNLKAQNDERRRT